MEAAVQRIQSVSSALHPSNFVAYSVGGGKVLRNTKFVQAVVWIIVVLVVAGLVLPVIASMFGLF
jgi:hypothetical protein